MAARFDETDGDVISSPRRSSLEADDGCQVYPRIIGTGPDPAKQNLYRGDICDSGVSLTSFGCELVPSLGASDPVKTQLTDLQTPDTCVSVGYKSFNGQEDIPVDSALEVQMKGLDISHCETVTSTSSTMHTTVCPVTQEVDPRREFIDRLNVYFTPDDDGDT